MAGYAPAALRVMGWGSEMRPYPVKMKGVRVMHSIESIFTKEEVNNAQTITSSEVAEMVGKEHKELLRDIRRYCDYLNEGKIALVDFLKNSREVA